MSDETPKLTDRQSQILDWIRDFIERRGLPPTQREIGDAHDISSTKGVRDHLDALERKGEIERIRGKSRGIVLLDD